MSSETDTSINVYLVNVKEGVHRDWECEVSFFFFFFFFLILTVRY